jgi:serine/threonine protein kinase/tetratricopeptide (TPR) repeat protein
MSCPGHEELELLAQGALEEPRAGRLESHLERCPSCALALEEVRANLDFEADWHGAWAAPSEASTAGARIPGYTLLGELHRGGQGVVYRARQESTRRVVAVKLLHLGSFASARQRRRFEREVDLAASLDHPNVVTVYDSGRTEAGELFLAMELVDGLPLDEHLRAAAPDVRARLRLFARICEAVHHAHQRGILHRDLKPGNILVDARGEPRVVDFGLAKPLEVAAGERSAQTLPGEFVGTLAYAAPEQLRDDEREVDVRSDVYGLGVILFEALTGGLPYDVSGSLAAVVLRILEAEPARPSERVPGLDPELDAIVAKALEKRPEERYESVAALAADVRHHLAGEPVDARADSGWYVLRKRLRRHRVALAVAALVLAVLVTATVVSSVFWLRSTADRDVAIRERNHLREVRDFQSRMIAAANPYADGHTVTVAELLDSAARGLPGEYAGQPELRAELEAVVADSYAGLRMWGRSGAHYEKAWGLLCELRGERHASTLEARVGLLTARASELPGSGVASELRDLVELCADELGSGHPTTLAALTSLARLREDAGRLGEAETLYREVAARDEAARVDEHEHVAALQNLAGCLLAEGRAGEAEPILRDAYDWQAEHLGPEHPATLTAANVLGQTWMRLGRLEEAESLLRETLETRRRLFGEESWVACASRNALGLCLLARGGPEAAEPVLRDAVRYGRVALPPHHLELLRVQRSLAGALWELGRLEEAQALLEETSDALATHHGEEHPDALETRLGLGCVLQARHEFGDAAEVFEELLARCAEDEELAVFTAEVRLYLGFSLSQLGLALEAEQCFRDGYEVLLEELGPEHPKTRAAREGLAGLFEQLGRFEEARRLRRAGELEAGG